ncbi:copper amine oxidase N-terminal domain-containing protein [Paenibacillus tritici]|uniref:Copper amine oxidase N-terminal domain-containing protein n=1 Tax=Paenibacillus tritici TaxID=1873425 RepID=A0ABX2DJP6_9BACL|nr:copper amine oxidase N-terminal domain-containing protein [Paenibacillus tritici]NQX43889.1 copper amine oxidase N-terminal domain-containing protein [Paenibacillus tritici]QUL57458.1 copper amine oxidase N-terminal domain-containing protein [Paenibacillus tritici]
MKKMKARTKWLVPILALLLILSGCQTVGGFDVNKALLGDLDVKSSESSTTMTLSAVPAVSIRAEDREIVDLINSLSLSFGHVKLQDNGNVSATGVVGYKEMKIPFSFFMDKTNMVFTAEGAKQPFYFPIQGYEDSLGIEGMDQAKTLELSKLISQFVVKNLPNPGAITVASVTESVYGQPTSLTKLHTEITGEELPVLLKSFLRSVSKDTEGFTALISGLYDYLYPLLKASGEEMNNFDFGLGEIPLDDKEGVVTVAHDAAKLGIDALLLVYDKQLEKLYEEAPELKTVLGKDTKLTVDMFVDSGFHVRKQNIDLKVALPASEDLPLQSINVKLVSETWNVNGPVTADPISTDGAIDFSKSQLTPGETLRSFEPSSSVYKLLKEDMGITSKSLMISPDDDYYYPIVDNGTTYVPLRYIAEDMDATVEWDAPNRAIKVTDDVYGDQLVFKIGSAQAQIAGKTVKLPQAVFVDEYGDAYVPLRVLAQGLHATVEVDDDGYIWIDRP